MGRSGLAVRPSIPKHRHPSTQSHATVNILLAGRFKLWGRGPVWYMPDLSSFRVSLSREPPATSAARAEASCPALHAMCATQSAMSTKTLARVPQLKPYVAAGEGMERSKRFKKVNAADLSDGSIPP
jgi:hypothetical protein